MTSGTPADDEEPVGVTLARMRKARGLTGADLAARVGMSQPKISRIERGMGTNDPEDISRIAIALGADRALARELRERAERSHNRMADWRPTSPSLAGRQKTVAEWESEVEVVRDFQPALLAGLLQTSGYASGALQAFQRLLQLGDQPAEPVVLAAVSARVARQEVLADTSKSFRFVMTEAVFRNQICQPAEMLAQLERLRELRRRPNVAIGVIPDGVPGEVPPLHGFTLFDDRMVVIDVYNTGLTSRGRADVAGYRHVFDGFEKHATTDIEPFLSRYQERYIEQLRRPPAEVPPNS